MLIITTLYLICFLYKTLNKHKTLLVCGIYFNALKVYPTYFKALGIYLLHIAHVYMTIGYESIRHLADLVVLIRGIWWNMHYICCRLCNSYICNLFSQPTNPIKVTLEGSRIQRRLYSYVEDAIVWKDVSVTVFTWSVNVNS